MTKKQGDTPPETAAAPDGAGDASTETTSASTATTVPAPTTTTRGRGAKAKDEAPAAAAAPDGAGDAVVEDEEVMPEATGRTDAVALNLLFDACERFNINPTVQQRPRELAAWRFYPGDRVDGVPAAVVLVTAGGLKIRHQADGSLDDDTEERLRAIFRAFKIDPVTKNPVPAPLPGDLSLPAEAVLGIAQQASHRHAGGYLRRPRT